MKNTIANYWSNHLGIITIIIIILTSFACKENCISCIAKAKNGEIVEHTIQCDKDIDYLLGFENGMKSRYRENGDTTIVDCIYKY